MFKRLFSIVSLLLLCCVMSCEQKMTFVTIGTGGVTGVYYPTGGAISRMINKQNDIYGIKMTVESTAGSVYNINAVLHGDLDFGIAQSDRQYQAVNGIAEWEARGAQKDLRSVFSIHSEAISLVTTDRSGIRSIQNLLGKRVNLGNPGSGQLQNSKDVLSAFNISTQQVFPEYTRAVEAPILLQDGRIDAFFYTVGHPNGNLKEASAGRKKIRFLSISGPEIEALVKQSPYYAKTRIPISYYPGALNKKDVETIGVKATLVTSKYVDDDIVYAVTKEVFSNLDTFKSLHPAYAFLTQKNMLEGLSAPLHPGALRYYKEIGLVD